MLTNLYLTLQWLMVMPWSTDLQDFRQNRYRSMDLVDLLVFHVVLHGFTLQDIQTISNDTVSAYLNLRGFKVYLH